jgi:F-type H+-transporting ATPase subunit delta
VKGNIYVSKVAEPYAQALMSLAQANNLTENFGEEIVALLSLLENSPELLAFLESPVVNATDKKGVLERILGGKSNSLFKNFLLLLVDRRRIFFLTAICEQYLTLLREINNTVLAELVSAKELNEQQKQAVEEKVKVLTKARTVELKTSVNPDLIGGVIIKVGSRVFDASLRGQLRRLSLSLGAK